MANFTWLGANLAGYRTLEEAISLGDPEVTLTNVITLSPNSKTKMWDPINIEEWRKLKEKGLKVHEIDRIEKEGKSILEEISPDYVVMIGWRQIIPEDVLSIPKKGFIATHPTMLPYGRGPAAIVNQILNGVTSSGVSLIYTSKGLDDGDIIDQYSFSLAPEDHATEFYEKTIIGIQEIIKRTFPLLARDQAPRIPQNDSKKTYFTPPQKPNRLNCEDTLETKFRKIKAVSMPYKGAYIKDGQGSKLRIWRAKWTTEQPEGVEYSKGLKFKDLATHSSLYFKEGDNYLKLEDVEIEQ